MRFHIGFSKFIKPSKLLKWLGIIFIGLLALLGIDKVNADTTWTNVYVQSGFFHSPYVESLTYSSNFNEIETPNSTLEWLNNYGKGVRFYNPNLGKVFFMPFAMSKGFASTSSSFWSSNDLITMASLKFNNSSYCDNSTSDLKSVNFQFPLTFDTNMQDDFAFFNQSSISDLFKVRISSHSSTNDENYNTYCNIESLEPSTDDRYKYNYLVTCNNVFQGNSNYAIDTFTIEIINAIPFNDRYSDSTEYKGIVAVITVGNPSYTMNNLVNYQLRYSCSDEPPVLDNGSGGDDDENGLNDIYVFMQDNFDSSIPGIDSTKFVLNLPNTITDLVSMPFDLVRAIVDNSTNNACQTYDIDFSSILHRWGGGNNNDSYVLHLPCMRSLLSEKLGSTFYTILDSMIAFYLFYNMVMFFISMIDAVTSGQDLYSYFFKDSDDEMLVSSYDGSYTRKRHWYE